MHVQIPYGLIIAISILSCVFLNDRFQNRRVLFVLLYLCPNIAGAFGLRFVPQDQRVGRLICYYLTGPYNAAFVLILSMQIANTAGEFLCLPILLPNSGWISTDDNSPDESGHTKKVVTNAVLFLGYCTGNIAGPFFYKTDQSYALPISSLSLSYRHFTNEYRPSYPLGIWSMITSHLIEVVLISSLGLLLRWENQKRDRIQSQMEGGLEGRDLDSTAFLDLTDRENLKYVIYSLYSMALVVLADHFTCIAFDISIEREI